jgi:hypothetical protein
MNDLTLTCPKCHYNIKLTEELAGPLLESTKTEYEQKLKSEQQKHTHDLAKARAEMEADALTKAKQATEDELKNYKNDLADQATRLHEMTTKLADAQKAQADFIRKQRELDDAKREMDLTIEKRVAGGVEAARLGAKMEAEESIRLRMAEKDRTLEGLQQQIEALKKKAEQGSQQLQGEVQEVAMETELKSRFPMDTIEPVGKGQQGGDILQNVMAGDGMFCGTILWESKRTKTWSDGWLSKLRDDQRDAKADIAILVTEAPPKGRGGANSTFNADFIEGVWVVSFKYYLAMALAMHQHLIDLAGARKSMEGQETKMGMVYEYLTGPRFKQRVQAIVEAFSTMKEDLDKEKKAITKQWAKRDEQIERVLQGTVGMYGDLQAIAGKSLGEIEGMSLKALEA